MPLYLGLDSSTQGLTAVAIDVDGPVRAVVCERHLSFDVDLPEYGTRHGVLPDDDPAVALSSPRLWADALDRMVAALAADPAFNQSRLAAVSGCAQQHGSVYLNAEAPARWSALDPARTLAPQLDGTWARDRSPIWMDTSTTRQCAEITEAMGGAAALAQLTGSRAFERFTAAQIRKFWAEDPAGYAATDRVHLVSSYLASLLAGQHAPIDPGDGSGMNLMALSTSRWAPAAVDATAPGLASKLPELAAPWTVAGRLAPYWTTRYGLPAAKVIAWTGDNPSSLVGIGLVREGCVGVSLGTSDTIFGAMDTPRVDSSGTGHVFGAPTGLYMGLTCFLNGSLAREHVRDQFGLDWAGFSRALRDTPPGNRGALMLPWFAPEITPPVAAAGVRTRGLDPTDAASHVRAVVEAQMLAMRRHSAWMGVTIDRIHATGGAASPEILQTMADVFGAEVAALEVPSAAALGAAMRAWHADAIDSGHPVPWDEIVDAFVRTPPDRIAKPRADHAAMYREMGERYAAFETEKTDAGQGCSD